MTYRMFSAVLLILPAFSATAQDVATRLDEYLQAQAKVKDYMGTALVAKSGKVILEKGYGFANVEMEGPNTLANKFRLGSITKQFTAAAIMQLQEQGKLSVNDLACKYVDNCPEAWKT